jgi:hypothetical protein
MAWGGAGAYLSTSFAGIHDLVVDWRLWIGSWTIHVVVAMCRAGARATDSGQRAAGSWGARGQLGPRLTACRLQRAVLRQPAPGVGDRWCGCGRSVGLGCGPWAASQNARRRRRQRQGHRRTQTDRWTGQASMRDEDAIRRQLLLRPLWRGVWTAPWTTIRTTWATWATANGHMGGKGSGGRGLHFSSRVIQRALPRHPPWQIACSFASAMDSCSMHPYCKYSAVLYTHRTASCRLPS